MQLDKVHTLRVMAIAQAVLWQRGHLKLAALITCSASDNQDTQQISSMGIGRLSDELQREIIALYPYQRYTLKREKTRPQHPPLQAIDILARQFHMRDWVLMLPDELTHRLVGNSLSRRYPCPYDIRNALGKLTIEVAKREIHQPLQENTPHAIVR